MSDFYAPEELGNEIRALRRRVQALERTPKFVPTSFPMAELGARHDFGYTGLDSTTFANVLRADVNLTAPILSYDLSTTAIFGTGITSVEWEIEIFDYGGAPGLETYTAASGSGPGQAAGEVDLFDLLGRGELAMHQFIRVDVNVKRTGGSGDAAVRLIRPMLLRIIQV